MPSVLRTWDLEQADLFNELQGEGIALGAMLDVTAQDTAQSMAHIL